VSPIAIPLSCAVAVALPLLARRLVPPAGQVLAARALAVLLLAQETFKVGMRMVVAGTSLWQSLPLHLCGIAALLGAWMLLARERRLFGLVWYWGIGGTLAALATPDLPADASGLEWLMFYAGHGLILLAATWGLLVLGYRPTLAMAGKAVGALFVLGLLMLGYNFAFDANFMYLRAKPQQPSPLDLLGPWPWYIPGLFAMSAAAIFVLWLPFCPLFRRRLRGGRGH